MNKILHLLDEEFALDYLKRKALPLYPQFSDIVRVKIRPYKKMIWETTYHVVIGFDVHFKDSEGEIWRLPLVCSAHSNEPRENVYKALHYLWFKKFNDPEIALPRPLFFSAGFNGSFYEAIAGENLLYYIKQNNIPEVEKIIKSSARLFARLHATPVEPEANFNPLNAHIKTVIPGVDNIFKEMEERYPGRYSDDLRRFYDYFISQEEIYFATKPDLKLIHGDAHPENIIKTGEDSIGIIDFTDFCLGDFARDLGTFTQQLEYKITTKLGDYDLAERMKKLFLETYLTAAGLDKDQNLENRMKLYYNWTAIRTATYLFLKFDPHQEQGDALFQKVKQNLSL